MASISMHSFNEKGVIFTPKKTITLSEVIPNKKQVEKKDIEIVVKQKKAEIENDIVTIETVNTPEIEKEIEKFKIEDTEEKKSRSRKRK